MRVASWRNGGRAWPTRIAIFAPCHRFRRAGINTFQWRSIAFDIKVSHNAPTAHMLSG